MKIVIISDTHNQANALKMPEGDILVHCGDFTGMGEHNEISKFAFWLSRQNYKHIIIIPGNHDWLCQKNPEIAQQLLKKNNPNLHYLVDQSVTIEGIKFYGSPITPTFGHWAFMRDRGNDIDKFWQAIPEDTEFLITHGPPMGTLDNVQGRLTGCANLEARIGKLKSLKYHAFGHIHEGYGTLVKNGVTYINASSVDSRYKPINQPIVIDYE